jgi:putative ABC transport system permease protein
MFTGVTLVTLAIGIGANSAIFSVVNGVLLKPLPYSDPDRLVGLWHAAPGIGFGKLNMSPAFYFTYREDGQTFQEVGLWTTGTVSVTGQAEPEQVSTLYVTDGTLPALGVQPVLGRRFSKQDDSPGTADTVMLLHEYWQRKFGGDRSVVGRTMMIDGRSREIIGILPESFRFLDAKPGLIIPYKLDRAKVFVGNFSYQGIARLKPGTTIEQANADVARLIPLAMTKFPPPPGISMKAFQDARIGPNVQPLKNDVIGDAGTVLWVLMGTIGIVLLIACANVANLLLVRAEGRQHELSIRTALGASWGQVARELLLESVLLGLVGGALGLGVAYAAVRTLLYIAPATLPRLGSISIDPLVVAFTVAISLFAGLLFGLVPVLKYAGPNVGTSLRAGGRTLSQSKERHRARSTLVVVQVALALVLLISSGLMIRTFQSLRQVQAGFTQPETVQTLRISIPAAQVKEPEAALRMQHEILRKIAAVPGVTAASFGNSIPMDRNSSNDPVIAEDRSFDEGKIPPIRRFKFTAPGYFQALGIPLAAGRDFTWTDIYEGRNVVMISENFAREWWGSPNGAIGKRIRENPKSPWREIIGVTRDLRDDGLNQKAPTIVFWPALIKQFWADAVSVRRTVSYAIRSNRTGTESFAKELQQSIWSVNPDLPVAGVRTVADIHAQSLARTSFTLVMLAIAGGMALILGVIGIYGVIAYSVSQRIREIGIRMALGAPQPQLRRMFLRHGLVLAGIGIAFGLAAALTLSRLMSSLLFEVNPVDPLTYVVVSVALVGAAAVASYLPARRASGVDPMEALRSD